MNSSKIRELFVAPTIYSFATRIPEGAVSIAAEHNSYRATTKRELLPEGFCSVSKACFSDTEMLDVFTKSELNELLKIELNVLSSGGYPDNRHPAGVSLESLDYALRFWDDTLRASLQVRKNEAPY